jgi:hypothetical protein
MVGSLMYAILSTRPDIAFSVSVISRYTSNPDDSHLKAVKDIYRYLRGTTNYELCFQGTLLTNLSSFEVLGSMLQTIIAIIL